MKDDIKGKAEELKGKVTGDRPEEMKGRVRQAADKTRRAVRDIRGDVHEEAGSMREHGREEQAVREGGSR